MATTSSYYLTRQLQAYLVDGTTPPFTDLGTMDDVWMYLYGTGSWDNNANGLIANLYVSQWYDGKDIQDPDEKRTIFMENKLLALPRIRMLKVHNKSCTVPTAFSREILECFDSYTAVDADTKPYGPLVRPEGRLGCLKDSEDYPVCSAWEYTGGRVGLSR